MLIDTSSGYHNLKLNEKSYLTTFSFPFGRYQYLLFGTAEVSNMFQKKIEIFFNDILNVSGIADDILIAGFYADGRDHDACVEQVL